MGLASLGGAAVGTTIVLTSEDHRVRNAAGAGVALAFPGFLGAGVAMTKGARHCSARDARLARLGVWSYLGLAAAPVMLASLAVVGAEWVTDSPSSAHHAPSGLTVSSPLITLRTACSRR
ncbi:MAG: hypothetical protein H6734_21965 [Alphaproteobacteria bacterium]|nr:hypothetical protein [Alphaproteobacteria bacterium]